MKLSPSRVVHFMDVCFRRTETFIYEFVRGCQQYEAWCVANALESQPGWHCPRIRCVRTNWITTPHWYLLGRTLQPILGFENLRLYWTLRSIRPSVIHAHFGNAGCQIRRYACKLGIPLLTSFYGFDAYALPRQSAFMQELISLFQDGAGFLVEGPAMGRRLVELGCPPNKIHLVPITVDIADYPFQHRQYERGDPLRMLFVGRFVPKKGLHLLLPALALARERLGPFQLRIIGGGTEESEIRRLTAKLSLGDHVQFLGFQSRADVLREMCEAHLLVAPSVTSQDGDSEGGAPTILLEAQACGLPVLTSTHADIPFVMASLYRDYLATEGSADNLADRLLALRDDSKRWPELAAAGREHVLSQHGSQNFRRLEQIYAQTAAIVDS